MICLLWPLALAYVGRRALSKSVLAPRLHLDQIDRGHPLYLLLSDQPSRQK